MAENLDIQTKRTGGRVVDCSGLENLAGESLETAETAENRPPLPAPDAMFTQRSEPDDGTQVGTPIEPGAVHPRWGMTIADFIKMIVFDLPLTDFQRIRRNDPKNVFAKHTYFARCTTTGNIKIGRSADLNGRIKQLKAKTGSEHVLLATIRGGENETSYHIAFREHRLHGEWFSPHPDILAEIDRLNAEVPA